MSNLEPGVVVSNLEPGVVVSNLEPGVDVSGSSQPSVVEAIGKDNYNWNNTNHIFTFELYRNIRNRDITLEGNGYTLWCGIAARKC